MMMIFEAAVLGFLFGVAAVSACLVLGAAFYILIYVSEWCQRRASRRSRRSQTDKGEAH